MEMNEVMIDPMGMNSTEIVQLIGKNIKNTECKILADLFCKENCGFTVRDIRKKLVHTTLEAYEVLPRFRMCFTKLIMSYVTNTEMDATTDLEMYNVMGDITERAYMYGTVGFGALADDEPNMNDGELDKIIGNLDQQVEYTIDDVLTRFRMKSRDGKVYDRYTKCTVMETIDDENGDEILVLQVDIDGHEIECKPSGILVLGED